MSDTPFFHVGLLVPDLEQAVARLTALFGLTFARTQVAEIACIEDPLPRRGESKFTFSLEGPPYLEVIEAREGVYGPEQMGLHHIGVWSEDARQSLIDFAKCGVAPGATIRSDDGGVLAWYSDPAAFSGVRFEIVDELARPPIETWLAGKEPEFNV